MTVAADSNTGRKMSALDWGKLLLLGGIWGGSFFFARIAVAEIHPLTLVLFRVAIAAAALHRLSACARPLLPARPAAGRQLLPARPAQQRAALLADLRRPDADGRRTRLRAQRDDAVLDGSRRQRASRRTRRCRGTRSAGIAPRHRRHGRHGRSRRDRQPGRACLGQARDDRRVAVLRLRAGVLAPKLRQCAAGHRGDRPAHRLDHHHDAGRPPVERRRRPARGQRARLGGGVRAWRSSRRPSPTSSISASSRRPGRPTPRW